MNKNLLKFTEEKTENGINYKNNRITLQIEQDDVIIKKRFAWGEIPIINLYYNEI